MDDAQPTLGGSPAAPGAGDRRTMVSVSGISKSFGPQVVLSEVSLDVREGEVVVIIGPSGGGKTTFLRCINYLEVPDEGAIEVDGQELSAAERPGRRAILQRRRTVGMVFQAFNVFTHMSVLRHVSLAQEKVLGRSRLEADERSRELLTRVGLGSKVESYPSQCSGGEQQRIAIARALALEPKVMLFDEPTSALDPELGYEVLTVMRDLAAGGMTMLVTSHEMHFAEEVADRVIFLAEGRIVEQGEATSVIRSPQDPRTKQFLRTVLER